MKTRAEDETKTEKLKINLLAVAQRIEEFEFSGARVSEIVERFLVPQSTVSTILKKKREIWEGKNPKTETSSVEEL